MPRRDATRAATPLRAADVAPRQNSAAAKVTDEATMNHVAEAYRAKDGWPVTVTDGAFDTPTAPTAGPPPYHLYEITPAPVFGFGTAGQFAGRATRYRF